MMRRGGHDLAGLAVAALHDLEIEPGLLHRLARRRRANAFDGGDGAAGDIARPGVRQERRGSPSTCTVQAPHWPMPQPNFVPVMPSEIADDPQQRHVVGGGDRNFRPVHGEIDHGWLPRAGWLNHNIALV